MDIELFLELLLWHDVDCISRILLTLSDDDDALIWHYSKSRSYTVKTSYGVVHDQKL